MERYTISATFHNGGDEKTVSVTPGDVERTVIEHNDELESIYENSYEIVGGGGDYYTIDLHPEVDDFIPVLFDNSNSIIKLKPGRYAVLNNAYLDETGEPIEESLFLVPEKDMATVENVELLPVEVTYTGNGEAPKSEGIIEGILWAMKDKESGSFVTLNSVAHALIILASLKLISDKLGIVVDIDDEKRPMIVKTGKVFTEAMKGKPNRGNEYWDTGNGFLADMGTLRITADSEKALVDAMGSSKALLQLNALATASNYKYEQDRTLRVQTTIDAMLEERGVNVSGMKKSAKSKARKKIKDELLALSNVSWAFKNGDGDFVRIPLAGGECSVKNGVVSFVFSSEFMWAVLNRGAGRLAVSPSLLHTNDKNNPYSMPIGFKLASHSYQNIGKANERTLSVMKLLNYVVGLPTYEQVKSTDRAYTRRIIEPLERDLNHLVDIGFLDYWEYCHAKGEPLENEEEDQRFNDEGDDCPMPYDTAIKLNIQWQLSEEYEKQRSETLKAREVKRLEAEAARQRNADRQKRIERKIETQIAKAAAKKEVGEK